MFSKKDLQWWTGVTLVCLLCSLVLFAFVARKPLCIDSKVVERIDSVSERGAGTAFRCGLHRHVDFDETIASVSRDLSKRLQKVEKFLDWIGPLKAKINITLYAGQGSVYRLQNHEIFANESILMSPGQLEKAIFKIWFRERAHVSLHEKPLIEESVTDLIFAAYAGQLEIQDPLSRLFLNEDLEAKWPRSLTTTKGFCRSIWRVPEQIRVCENLSDFVVGEEKLDLNSLRPLISQALFNAYQKIPATERMSLMKVLGASLSSWAFDDVTEELRSEAYSQRTLTEASFLLESWTKFLEGISIKFSTLFSNDLKARGFQGMDMVADLDLLVFSTDLKDEMKLVLQQELKKSNRDLFSGWISNNQIKMNLDGEAMNVDLFGGITATKGIYLHCGQPDLPALTKAAARVQRLLYVDSCDLKDLRLAGYMKKGTVEFALQNPKVKFVDFHSPSLLTALHKVPGVNPIEALAAKDRFQHFFRHLGWIQPNYDKSADAYRAQSAIEAIDWYRL